MLDEKSRWPSILTVTLGVTLGLVLGLAIVWLIWRLSVILLPFFLAGLAAYLLNPLLDRLEKRGLSRTCSTLLLTAALLAVIAALGFALVPRISSEVSGLIQDYENLAGKAQVSYQRWLVQTQDSLPPSLSKALSSGELNARLLASLQWLLGKIPGLLVKLLQSIGGFMGLMVITLILAYWMLKEYHPISRRLLSFLPEGRRSTAVSLSRQVNKIISDYLLGLLLLCALAAAAAIVILILFGVDYGYLLGLLTGAGYAIPYFGVPIAAGITLIVAALTGQPWPNLLGIAACLLGLNFALDYLLSPRIIGKRIGLHPLTVIFALLAAGELFGFIGIIIALPLAAAIQACLAAFFPHLFYSQTTPAPEEKTAAPKEPDT